MSNETLRAEAALCIWEAMLEWHGHHLETGGKDAYPHVAAMTARWNAWGTVEMRHAAIALAPVVLQVYDMIGQERLEELGLIAYDWDFVPAVLSHVEWQPPRIDAPFTADAATIAAAITVEAA